MIPKKALLTTAISEKTKAPTNNNIIVPENNDPKARRPKYQL
ncbi:25286_t:CDS:2 [Gigaspora margarita]|uniref:25286_t:CDS:1 n=1 Tax=Gigaspora margarita TaxID=4874 RepID=A0ABN7UNI0_GIGMA|nr:25286_t:CDS:2 [Gigaspora margarita]